MRKVSFLIIVMILCSCKGTFRHKDTSVQNQVGKELWTKTNLHLFEKQYIYWQNYLSGEILPVGTSLRLKEVYEEGAILTDNYNKDFILYWKNDSAVSFKEVFDRYFQLKDPKIAISQIGNIESIALGEVKRGMSKQQTLISLGYPPNTKNLEDEIWIYWESEFHRRAIYFENDKVTDIVYSQ